ncbi:MAG: hypothetical protein AAF074_22800 [Pseudomonadota bacterium]
MELALTVILALGIGVFAGYVGEWLTSKRKRKRKSSSSGSGGGGDDASSYADDIGTWRSRGRRSDDDHYSSDGDSGDAGGD